MSYEVVMKSHELYHHGILGMKWGVQNGPPYPLDYKDKSAIEKRLNSLEKEKAQAAANAERAAKKWSKSLKVTAKKNKDGSGEIHIRPSKKFEKLMIDAQRADEEWNRLNDEINSIISEAEKMGFDVGSTARLYSVDNGRDFVKSLLTGGTVIFSSSVPGLHYKINDKQKPLSQDEKKSMLDRAKNNDSWNIDFLESIQNSEIAYKDDTKSMLKEYKKFLNDPETYMREDARKLKQV